MLRANFPGRRNERRQRALERLMDNMPRKPKKAARIEFVKGSLQETHLRFHSQSEIDRWQEREHAEALERYKSHVKYHQRQIETLTARVIPQAQAMGIRTKKRRSGTGPLAR